MDKKRTWAGDVKTLVERLRGRYRTGPEGEFGVRDFSKDISMPQINLEAADRIEELEKQAKCRNVEEVVAQYLNSNGYDGLRSECGDCGCLIDNLGECGESIQADCIPAYSVPEHTQPGWSMVTEKPDLD